MEETGGWIRTEQRDAAIVITLDRARRRNALNSEMYRGIGEAVRSADADKTVRAIILRGEGQDYCAGNDISDFSNFGDMIEGSGADPKQFVDRERAPSVALVHILMEARKPIIAAIQGNAVGFGATMLLLVDFVIAAPDAKLRFPFVDLAMVPEAGSSQLLKERVGYLKATEILMLKGVVQAEEAKALGLVNEVVDHDTLIDRALEIAGILANKPPIALAETKALLRRDTEALVERVGYEFERIAERTTSAEAQALFKQFLNR